METLSGYVDGLPDPCRQEPLIREWLGCTWGHAVAPYTPPQDLRRPPARIAEAVRAGVVLMRGSQAAGTGERGNELRRVDRAPAAGQIVPGRRVVAGHAAQRVVAGGDVDDRT